MEKLAIYGGNPVRETKIENTKPFFDESEVEAAVKSIKSGNVAGDGPFTRELEEAFAKYLGIDYVLFVNSATAALHMAMLVGDIKNKQVICPDYTFTSTALCSLLNNAIPLLVDVNYEDCNISLEAIKRNISANVKSIIPVHYAGMPCDMDSIKAIAEENSLFLVEDAAQAIGSLYKEKKVGTLADIGCFSLHATKNLSCGEGGFFVTNDPKLAEKGYTIRDKGTTKFLFLRKKIEYYTAVSIGSSFVQSDILAAIALEQLKKIDKITHMRYKIAEFYTKKLKELTKIILPSTKRYAKANWSLYTIKVPEKDHKFFIEALNAEGISVSIHYIPLHMNPLYKNCYNKDETFYNSKKIYGTLIKIPIFPSMTKEDMENVVIAIKKVYSYLYGQ